MLNDGQYGMSFLFTCPFGWLIGALIGLARALDDKNTAKPRNPTLISFSLIAGGCLVLPIFGMMFMLLLISFVAAIVGAFIEFFR